MADGNQLTVFLLFFAFVDFGVVLFVQPNRDPFIVMSSTLPSRLPRALLRLIATFVDVQSLRSLYWVCREWHRVCRWMMPWPPRYWLDVADGHASVERQIRTELQWFEFVRSGWQCRSKLQLVPCPESTSVPHEPCKEQEGKWVAAESQPREQSVPAKQSKEHLLTSPGSLPRLWSRGRVHDGPRQVEQNGLNLTTSTRSARGTRKHNAAKQSSRTSPDLATSSACE